MLTPWEGGSFEAVGAALALSLEQRTELNRQIQQAYDEYATDPNFIPEDKRAWRSVTVRDFGGGLVEVGYCAVRGAGASVPKEVDESRELFPDAKAAADHLGRSVRRSRAQVRRKCMAGGLDHLLTLTYRENFTDVACGYVHFKRFVRLVRSRIPDFPYLAVHEFQKRGAVHFHVAVRGFQDVRWLRACWLRVVGAGNIDVQVPGYRGKAQWKRARLAGYLTKYICKESAELNARQRYRVSEGIEIPGETRVVQSPQFVDVVAEIFDSLGVPCSFHWKNPSGPNGWACSW